MVASPAPVIAQPFEPGFEFSHATGLITGGPHGLAAAAGCVAAGITSAAPTTAIATAFAFFGLDWHEHVLCDRALLRPSDISYGAANPALARQYLGWQAAMDVDRVVAQMCRAAAGETPRTEMR